MAVSDELENTMTFSILVAGVLCLLAFLIHAIAGDKEHRILKPPASSSDKTRETWVQVRSGWHWVSVDLFLAGVLLIVIAITDMIKAKDEILMLLSIYFFCCGVVWLSTVFLSRNNNRQIIVLGQWIFCFIMSGLLVWGQL